MLCHIPAFYFPSFELMETVMFNNHNSNIFCPLHTSLGNWKTFQLLSKHCTNIPLLIFWSHNIPNWPQHHPEDEVSWCRQTAHFGPGSGVQESWCQWWGWGTTKELTKYKSHLSKSAEIALSILSPGSSLNASLVGMNTVPWCIVMMVRRNDNHHHEVG